MIGFIFITALVILVLLFIYLPVVAWSFVGLCLALVLIVLIMPVGTELSYIDKQIKVLAKVGPASICLYPRNKAEGKPKKEPIVKEKKLASGSGEKKKTAKKLNFCIEEIIELLKKAVCGLGKFGKLTVHKFVLHFTAAGKDPYNTAMTFSWVNAGLSCLAPLCRQNFRIKDDVDVWTRIDFNQESLFLEAELTVSLRLIQVLHAALAVAFGALPILIKNRRRITKEKRMQGKVNNNGAADKNREQTEQSNSYTEERTDKSNG